MKKVKKLLAMVMAMTMMLGLGLTSFAADGTANITVNGLATTGTNTATYVQILEPDVTAESGYKYADGVEISGYGDAGAFIKASVAEQKAALTAEGTTLPTATTGRVANNAFTATVGAGYYVVNITNTAGADDPTITYDNPMILSVEYDKATLLSDGTYEYNAVQNDADSTVTAKYTSIPVTKSGEDKDNGDETVEISGTATYEIVTFIPSEVRTFTLTDVLTGATYQKGTESVKIEGSDENIATSVVKYNDDGNMVITLTDYLAGNVGKKVTITYDVTVTGVRVNNTVTPDDGKHEYTSASEELYTGGIQLTKYNEDESKTLSGAKFVVYKDVVETVEGGEPKTVRYYATAGEFIEEATSGVLVGWTTDKDSALKLVSGSDGVVTLDGLDLGTYYFEEVEAPQGYSVNKEPAEVIVTEKNTTKEAVYDRAKTEMVDTTLASLPSTGGIGTTIFTIGGCAIMIAAAALYFVNRRKSEEN